MIGRTISHYRVEKRLGAGGMGEVYLARDLALNRAAALKLLPGDLDSALKPRLLREAEASARLQHPAIATFYEAGESDGVAFIAMEYVPGQTLRDRLADGPLPIPEALSMTASLLEALGHAHAAGILHRDIKPENVMLASGSSAKLLDFGIAKLFVSDADPEEATATALTATGEIIGTVGYMSPEQLKGLPLDGRTDLFSLGAVLYEALSGKRAFPGRTAGERIAAILTRDPAPLQAASLPPELRAVLSRALAREPSQRYASAASFLSDLKRATEGEFVSALPDTLAVMDFENLSRNPDDDWIGSGVAESVGAELARVPGLTVVAREKALKVRKALGGAPDALDLGHALGCRWVLSGSYQRMGPALRITSRLSEVATGRVVSSEKLDGTLEEIFQMQDRLATSTAAILDLTVPAAPAPSAARNLDAYERYARGRRLFHQLGKGTFEQARELFEEAIAADPGHAPALAGLSAVHAMRFTFTTDPGELEKAAEYARRAIASDERLGEPHIWLGYSLWRQWRVEEAFREEERAMELDPANPFAPYFAGWCRISSGHARRRPSPLPARDRGGFAARLELARRRSLPYRARAASPRGAGASSRRSRWRGSSRRARRSASSGISRRVSAPDGRHRRGPRALPGGNRGRREIGPHVPRYLPGDRSLRARAGGPRPGGRPGGEGRVLAGDRAPSGPPARPRRRPSARAGPGGTNASRGARRAPRRGAAPLRNAKGLRLLLPLVVQRRCYER